MSQKKNIGAKLVTAGSIPDWAGCFRKSAGTYTYLRISEASVRFHKLDSGFVYGVAFNGNICKLAPDTLVVRMKLSDMVRDSGDTTKFEREVLGCKQTSEE